MTSTWLGKSFDLREPLQGVDYNANASLAGPRSALNKTDTHAEKGHKNPIS